MNKLWAPWRVKYLEQIVQKQRGCVFCQIAKEKNDKKNLVFVRTRYSFVVLNLYPYNNGHALILPYRHVNDLDKLSRLERDDLMDLMSYTKKLLDKAISPDGYNVGMNLGRTGGAGFPGHVHIHVVPRWTGDVNFMPVVANTKVISQSLSMLYGLLVRARKELTSSAKTCLRHRTGRRKARNR